MSPNLESLGKLTKIRTGKLDANASSPDGEFPFFTCAKKPLRISSYTYDCECVLVAGNGDLNVKYFEGKFDAYQRTYIIEKNDDVSSSLHLRYVYHFLEKYLEKLREQSIGGIIKYIKLGNLTEAKIPLPPLEEQKRIAGILDAADALRAKRRETLAQLDTFLQSTFLELFGDPAQNRSISAPKRQGGEWSNCTLGDQIMLQRGKDITKKIAVEGNVPVISSGGVSFFHNDAMGSGPGVLLGRKGSVGNVHYSPCDYWPHDTTLYVRDFKGNEPLFVFHFFKNFPIADYEASAANPSLNRNNLHPVRVIWPPINLQHHFAAIVESVEQQKAKQRAHLAELDALFASLQSRAFNGEL